MIVADTVLRVGELSRLRCADVLRYESISGDQNRVDLVKISVRAETAQNRKSCTILSRGGKYLKPPHEIRDFWDDDHFVFSIADGFVKEFSTPHGKNSCRELASIKNHGTGRGIRYGTSA